MVFELRRIGAGAAIALAIFLSPTAAQDVGRSDDTAMSEKIGSGPLDGMSFVGKIGPEESRDLDDELHFVAGQFWSSNCVACGYKPGNYWTRTVGDSIQFRGSLQSSDRGKFEFSGRVEGERVFVSINWTQQRWYGDIVRKLAFVGALAPTASLKEVPFLQIGKGSVGGAQCRRL